MRIDASGTTCATNQDWATRLECAIPWGSCTCSKASKWRPEEPGVIVRGDGCRVWDAEGREFIDYRNALGPITLGFRFPAVDEAIRRQLDAGMVFGHPHPLECEVAEELIELIPTFEQCRFLKTGGEAIAACIRLARCCTGRDHIIQIGYNGWLNGLASGGRVLPGQEAEGAPPGVPKALSAMHHSCGWADLDGVEQVLNDYPRQVAAIVVAADYACMEDGKTFYPALRKLADDAGSLLVLDEIVTGFRIAMRGVQEYFGVRPDLAVYAKGISNGMPLSVFGGPRELMKEIKNAVVTSTFGGETLSLAAARAVLEVYRSEDVIGHFWRQGETLWRGLNEIFRRYGVPARASGLWPSPILKFESEASKDLPERFYRAAYREGVSLYDISYVNFSHKDSDIQETLQRLDAACDSL